MKINTNNNINMQTNYNDKNYKDYNDKYNNNYNNIIIKDDKIKDMYDEKKDVDDKIPEQSQTDIIKLVGIDETTFNNNKNIANKQNWKYCAYCEKFHGNEFFMQLDYCIHCWGWLNMQEINLETGKYTGTISFDTVKSFIKKVYPIHFKANCTNKECVFNKITELAKNNKLNIVFTDLIFEKTVKKEEVVSVNINIKNHKLNINFDKSEISI